MLYKHLAGYRITSLFSEDGLFRYRLMVEHPDKLQGKTLCVIMQNPSDADTHKSDKSVQFLENLVFTKDYKVFKDVRKMIIVNQFAFVQKHGFDGREEHIGEKNDAIINEAIKESDIILLAWGRINPYQQRKQFVFEILTGLKNKLVLMTKKHPSRGFYEDFIELCEPADYQ